LTDPQKKAAWDQFGAAALTKALGPDLEDLVVIPLVALKSFRWCRDLELVVLGRFQL